ncbi:hypothetical protein [Pseudomonas asiatica]|uniref:hypothetical protein n=1 Tax=Pseudomonas asiatica TaxID=2219225 RepID=UPI0025A3B221|nr:hypothetical protein [Pseudomonas asiatica]WJN52563.1 hypothetical protein QUR91_12385 [Pseudomonas asiatica]
MSDLKKMVVTIKNYDLQAVGDLDELYTRVRLEDEQGNTFYFKQVVVPKYLRGHGAMAKDVPRTWYFKYVAKKSIVLIAYEKANGKVEYDLDDFRVIARATVLKGIVVALLSIPGGVIAATATFGLGLVIIPMGVYYGYRNVFRLPKMLSRKKLIDEFSAFGISVR